MGAHQKKLQLIVQQKLKFLDSSPTELNDSCTIDKNRSSNSPEPGDSAGIEKPSSGTLDKVSSSSSSEHCDSGTLEKLRSQLAEGPQISDGPGTLENMYEDLHRTMTLKFIASANEHQESMETCKKLHKQGLVSKEKYSEFKTLSNKSSKEMKYIIRNLNDLFKDLIDHVRKEVTKRVTVVKDSEDEPQELVTNDDMLCRSLALSCLKDSDDESNKAPQNLAIIDGILEKGKQARKCANWFLYRACNLEILCDDILYTWIFNSLGLTNYANIMDISLRVSDGVDKEKMMKRLWGDSFFNAKKDLDECPATRRLHRTIATCFLPIHHGPDFSTYARHHGR